jgi:hypothetical protein
MNRRTLLSKIPLAAVVTFIPLPFKDDDKTLGFELTSKDKATHALYIEDKPTMYGEKEFKYGVGVRTIQSLDWIGNKHHFKNHRIVGFVKLPPLKSKCELICCVNDDLQRAAKNLRETLFKIA